MKYVTLVIALLLTNTLWAKPALVKSGEHSNFSRLVLYTGDAQTWSHSRSNKKVTIRIDGWSSGFDTSEVFKFIPQDRITKLNPTNNGLELTLGCDCPLEIEPVEQGGIMINVLNEPDPASSQLSLPTSILNFPEPEGFILQSAKSSEIAAFRKNLTERLGKATTQEILTAVPTEGMKEQKSQEAPFGPPGAPTRGERIRTTSATERAALRQKVSPKTDLQCPPDQYGNIESWGTDEPFSEQLGRLRRSVSGEFDVTDQSQALKLSQLYLFFAMGAEAIATIQTFEQTEYTAQFLKSIARVLDDERAKTVALDLPDNGCVGSHAIWAAVLGRDQEAVAEDQAKIITEAFARLPHHLKSILGPSLMTRLKRDDQEVAASVIQNLISNRFEEIIEYGTAPTELGVLSVLELEGMVAKNNNRTPQALVALLDAIIREGEAVSVSLRDVARSFVVQQRGEPVAVEITALLSKEAAIRKEYTAALESALTISDEAKRTSVISFVADHLIHHGQDIDVAKFALQLGREGGTKYLKREALALFSERLMQTGVTELAGTFSQAPASSDHTKLLAVSKQALKNTAPKNSPTPTPPNVPTLANASNVLGESKLIRESIIGMLKAHSR